jgi:DNA helicase II / ATP-dependent DNA helicase PcrA
VLQIAAHFLQTKPLMQLLLINRFPILLIDESQDTNAALIDALFTVERQRTGTFALGLFGDMMQRIYADGKHDLGRALPTHWKTPAKPVNHRSAKRIVRLGNALRRKVDGQEQVSPAGKAEGHVRLFVARAGANQKPSIERRVRQDMASVTGDRAWLNDKDVTVLALEHQMAASRLGFAQMWQALYSEDRLKRGLIDGDLPGLRLFSERVRPVVQAADRGDRFAVAEALKQHSPLLSRENLLTASDQRAQLARAREAVDALATLIASNPEATFLEVLRLVDKHGLFGTPEALQPFVEKDEPDLVEDGVQEETDEVLAWRAFLEVPYRQIDPYARYIADDQTFDTHHGVKGLEFPRVLVLLDDTEARGFMYSYEKLLGVTPLAQQI